MKKSLFAVAVTAVVSLPSLALACEKPQAKPDIPNPDTAVTAQMVKSNNEVKAYVKATEQYLNCANLSSGQLKKEEKALRAYAEKFNQTIRAFKKRQG